MSQLFSIVKANVNARQAADAYGLKVGRNGMACCPFHRDKSPSMKVDRRYYCFGCGVTGDAIDLTAKLLNLTPKDAALRLANDFGLSISENRKSVLNRIKTVNSDTVPELEPKEWLQNAVRILLQYRDLLKVWETQYAPKNMDDEWHPLFCEALNQKNYIEYLLDELLQCSKAQFMEMKNCCRKEVDRIEKRLSEALTTGEVQAGRGTKSRCRSSHYRD
ncbi:MAG: CHC2 zinc finger domain-containing protein [Eubacteriales bacterium]|nr:CHC2 zinc finger domain-containing protein [Eubacteriales bacterium]